MDQFMRIGDTIVEFERVDEARYTMVFDDGRSLPDAMHENPLATDEEIIPEALGKGR